MLSDEVLAGLNMGEDPTAPKKAKPGLTGADLELAHANREFDTADKIAQQANHDATDPSQPRSAIHPALHRGLAAVDTMHESHEDQSNIRRLIAALTSSPRR